MTTPETTAHTRLTGLIGYPVAHSLSPRIHGAAIRAAGLDAVYLAFAIPPDQVISALKGLMAAGVLGLNATIPHKFALMEVADRISPEARLVGAANTLYRDGNLWVAHNTDVIALRRELADLGVAAGDVIEIVGAGGAARAVAVAAGQLGARVSCWARDRAQGDAIEALAQASVPGEGQSTPIFDHRGWGSGRVIVNATPLGRYGEALPDPFMHLTPAQVAYDLNYGPLSPFLTSAQDKGVVIRDGIGMLIGQAEAAYACWFNQLPPSDVMKSALISG